jgi:hypothetical protein
MAGDESTTTTTTDKRTGLAWRKVAAIGGIWAVLVAGALGVAAALDSTPAPPPPESVAPEGLPPLFLYLDRPFPAEITKLQDAAAQITKLQELATTSDDPARWVELAAVSQRVGDLGFAKQALDRALALEPGRLDATIGLVMSDGATGPEGLARAAAALAALAPNNEKSQLLAFNTGMVGIYRADRETIASALTRAIALGPETPLGILAKRFSGAGLPSSANP